ncbi:MAG: hypothetical protein ACWGOY_09585 [Anaerolineales bacterium]
MSLAERIYSFLVNLYPEQHRQAFKEAMLQHARDLNREAQQQSQLDVAWLWLHLVMDGIENACKEHWDGIMMTNNRIKPAPWLSVMLAALPGLLILLTRRISPQIAPLDLILWYLYLGLLVFVVPIIIWRRRRFPVWALLPMGALVWFLVYKVGLEISGLANSYPALNRPGMQAGIALLNMLIIIAVWVTMLRSQRLPRAAWIVGSVMVVGNLVLAFLFSWTEFRTGGLVPGMVQYFTTSGVGPLEGLMLVSVGLLFAREHGVRAALVVVGGYSYMFFDSDYLFGYPRGDWAWLSLYFAAITLLYLVVTPIALLRAKTRLGRALALFVPVITFHLVRFSLPFLVIQQSLSVRAGEAVATINILLSLILAWVLYSYIGDTVGDAQPSENLEATPIPN